MARTQLIADSFAHGSLDFGPGSSWQVRHSTPHLRLVMPSPHPETAGMRRRPLLGLGIAIGFSAAAWLGIFLLVV